MARITVEDALRKADNRFALVMLTARRAKQLLKGSAPLADIKNNRAIVAALREIAAGKVTMDNVENLPDTPGKQQVQAVQEQDDAVR